MKTNNEQNLSVVDEYRRAMAGVSSDDWFGSPAKSGFKKTPWGEAMRWLKDRRASFRAWLGLCPACNSDAPEIDHCWLCRGYRWHNDGVPTRETKRLWIHRWYHGPGSSPDDLPNDKPS